MSKPRRNRVMCPDCGRAKMLFESESKAENFIKWNGDDIDTHGDGLRAYYCPACCGWHITHKKHRKSYDHRTDELIEAYNRLVETSVPGLGYPEKIDSDAYNRKIAREIWDSMSVELRCSLSKKCIRQYITSYFEDNGVTDDGLIRVIVYDMWMDHNKSLFGAKKLNVLIS